MGDVLSLAKALSSSVSELIGESKNTVKLAEKEEMILKGLDVVDSSASRPILYSGIDEVINGWKRYWKDYDIVVDSSWQAYQETDPEWCKENRFILLYDKENKGLYAIRDFGMYCPEPEDFLFVTKYIPVYTHQPESKEQLLERINKIDTILNYEINKMMNTFNKPLFIVRHCGMNNYLAWSLAEKKFVCVYDYKKYRDNFRISPYDSYAQKDIVDNTEYGIIPPSEELINGLWLQLHSSIWENKMRWDKWEEREVKEKGDYVAYQDIYEKGID